MGIDTPAFSQGVERPQDTAGERGQFITVTDSIGVSSGSTVTQTVHTNTSDARQFVRFANLGNRVISSNTDTGDQEVRPLFTVQDPGGTVTFRVTGGSFPITQELPGVPVEVDGSIEVDIGNATSFSLFVDVAFLLRQGINAAI
jgi:hypothetical protein